ncbi:FMN-dependent NADH-azoreductase [Thermoactinomyces mirandus]|uniref:FMN dependent NADH:quinone oxidoreductase n=1 Tax=Thermoactinomyces mirandus TaxID=2756294 RepID=A0A7W1XPL5_9BACL|nr:FMN-dependent NADH-azoreductase [Thermoactinomyces mirandus]MBA4600851.1 FMN-dependent NADH-azoreductase [Thermoactinomyces mirandus]
MANILYITANPKPEQESFSLRLGRNFIEKVKELSPRDEIVEMDLYQTGIPFIDADVFSGWGKLANGQTLSAEEQKKVDRINELTDQFVEADKYVFVSPMWNLSIPSRLKLYIDTICIAGKTFKYTEEGPVGLLQGKKAVHVHARGGIYSEGLAKEMEFADRYLCTILKFMGISDIQSVIAEGMAANPQEAESIFARALAQVPQAAARFVE